MAKQEKPTTKICKFCKTEIPFDAKVCPQCRKKVKQSGCFTWLMILIVAVFGISLFSGDEQSSDGPHKVGEVGADSSSNASTAPIQDSYAVGDILKDGDMKIVYVASGEYKEDNEFSQPKEGYKYIFLKFVFENESTTHDCSISSFNFECYADGYAVDSYYGGEEDLSATLSAGRTSEGYIYFTVPKDAKEIEIEYETNFITEEKIKFVYEGEKDSGYTIKKDPTPTKDAYKVGDIVQSSKLKISYLACEDYKSDNMFIQPAKGYKYITCTFEFENVGKNDEYISSGEFDCYADGISCNSIYIRDDNLSATLSAGRKTKGTVTFEVPTNASVVEVDYLSNYWTSNRVVFTAK